MNQKPLRKLLITDNDDDTLKILKYCLQTLKDIEIKYVTSGEETVKEALLWKPDLILLDVVMPKMDGITTMRVLRLLPSTAHIAVIFLTSRIEPTEIENYFKEGVLDVIIKPFDPLALASNIQVIWNR
ncbi:MAG TPA: response regulator [Chlamydiales bacterium]|nr:response regulator [Chlamydiales bacterium]